MNKEDIIKNKPKKNKNPYNIKPENILDLEKKEKEEPIEADWEPKWIRLKMSGITLPTTIAQDGKLIQQLTTTPDGYVDIPENLVDEVESGMIDPTKYTREQLRRMSLDKHSREQSLSSMINEIQDTSIEKDINRDTNLNNIIK